MDQSGEKVGIGHEGEVRTDEEGAGVLVGGVLLDGGDGQGDVGVEFDGGEGGVKLVLDGGAEGPGLVVLADADDEECFGHDGCMRTVMS